MRAYMMLSTDPMAVSIDAAEISAFLETNMGILARGRKPQVSGMPCRDCKAWNTLKKSIKDAGVQPLDLVRRNVEIADVEANGACYGGEETFVLKRVDWYQHVTRQGHTPDQYL
jgi:hypothetical protein